MNVRYITNRIDYFAGENISLYDWEQLTTSYAKIVNSVHKFCELCIISG